MISQETRQVAINVIREAVKAGARHEKAYEILELPITILRRWEALLCASTQNVSTVEVESVLGFNQCAGIRNIFRQDDPSGQY